MALGFIMEDVNGNDYDLTEYTIDFGRVKIGETKVLTAYLLNTDPNEASCVNIFVKAHPTDPKGAAVDSVDVIGCGGTDSGPFLNPYNIGCVVGGGKVTFYIQWAAPSTANPGAVRVALHTTGVQTL